MAAHLLTDTQIRNAKPKKDKPYRLRDGEGLFLYVPTTGVKAWQLRYKLDKRHQTYTLGRLDRLSLAEAREEAAQKLKMVAQGLQLTTEKRLQRAQTIASSALTFGSYAKAWVKSESHRARWTEDYEDEVAASITNHLADLDSLPLTRITAAIAAPVLRRSERDTPDMAKKVRQRLRAIFDQAVEDGLVPANPIPVARRRKGASKRTHLPALTGRGEVGQVLRAADAAEVSRGVRRAHLLAAFTVQRVGEIVPAEWSEFDLETGIWAIPRVRMKMKDEDRGPHEIPLPSHLLSEVRDWRRMDGEDALFVCPAPRNDNHVTREALEKFYRRGLGLSGKHSPHSWRSVIKSWCADAGKDKDVVEAQLDHIVGSRVENAYDRAKRINLRHALLSWYEEELLRARDGAKVIQLNYDAA